MALIASAFWTSLLTFSMLTRRWPTESLRSSEIHFKYKTHETRLFCLQKFRRPLQYCPHQLILFIVNKTEPNLQEFLSFYLNSWDSRSVISRFNKVRVIWQDCVLHCKQAERHAIPSHCYCHFQRFWNIYGQNILAC